MADTEAKLARLLPHWAEHNEAHLETYREWAARAREAGLERTARALEEAVAAVGRATEALGRAADGLRAER